MSLLDNVVSQVLKGGLNTQNQPSQSEGIGGLLGSVMGNQAGQSGIGGLLGQIAGSQLGNQSGSQVASVLGSLLGNQSSSVNAGQLGGVLAQVLGGQKQQEFNKNTLLIALLPVVLGYVQKNGGLSGVLAKFQDKGLGGQARSWVSDNASNAKLTPESVMGLFSQDEISSVCQTTGASQNEVCQGIADLLPKVVDSLTPTGNLASEKTANQEISELLSGFYKKP